MILGTWSATKSHKQVFPCGSKRVFIVTENRVDPSQAELYRKRWNEELQFHLSLTPLSPFSVLLWGRLTSGLG